jgi:hypothetical protein
MKGLKLEKDLLPDDVYFQYTTVSSKFDVYIRWNLGLMLCSCVLRKLDWVDDVDHDAFWDRLRGSDNTLRRVTVLPQPTNVPQIHT